MAPANEALRELAKLVLYKGRREPGLQCLFDLRKVRNSFSHQKGVVDPGLAPLKAPENLRQIKADLERLHQLVSEACHTIPFTFRPLAVLNELFGGLEYYGECEDGSMLTLSFASGTAQQNLGEVGNIGTACDGFPQDFYVVPAPDSRKGQCELNPLMTVFLPRFRVEGTTVELPSGLVEDVPPPDLNQEALHAISLQTNEEESDKVCEVEPVVLWND